MNNHDIKLELILGKKIISYNRVKIKQRKDEPAPSNS